MDRKFFNLLCGVSLFIGFLLLNGCDDKDYYDPKKNPSDSPSTLDFSTSRTVEMDFNYNVSKGFKSTYDIYTVNPFKDGILRTDIAPIASGISDAGEIKTRNLANYVTDLYLYSPGLFVPTLSHAKVENGRAVFSQIDVPGIQSNGSRSTRSIGNKSIDKYLKQPSDFYSATANGNYENDLINPDEQQIIPTEVLTAINAAFPDGSIADSKFYADATVEIKSDNGGQGVRVYVSVIHAAGLLNNSLSYFTYKGTKAFKDFTEEERNSLKVINVFKYADVYTNSTLNKNKGLTPGKYAQLLYIDADGNESEFFPVGTKIGWILHCGGYDGISNNVNNNEWMYSTPEWNTPVNGNNNRTIFFETKDANGTTFSCFGFEDCPSYDNDCNDVIFSVLTDPADAIVPPPAINVEDLEKEEVKKGILAFEDLWPAQGDYDLNDVVVKYNSTITYIQEVTKNQDTGAIIEYGKTCVKKVTDVFSFIHTGADYSNAFYYKVDINPSIIKSVKIDGQNYTPVNDGSGFIIELCPNVADVIKPKTYGVTPFNYTVEIEFERGKLSENDFIPVTAPYNPFIVPEEAPGVEVHLPNYAPTSRVDLELFGTKDDRSDKKTLWYVSGADNQYPFAIHLANANDDFVVPAEAKPIYITYPDYAKWVESNMTDYQNWYLNPAK